ncbi:MAG: flagellar motor protein MotB [Candidatus Omnitrophota bacterium]
MVERKNKEEAAGGAPEWMCTFSDMMSLLLCFFVLLFAMSTVEKQKFAQTIGSIQGALGRIPNMFNNSFVKPITIKPQIAKPVQRTKTVQRAKEAIAKKARSRLVADEASKEIIVEGVDEGLRFSIAGRILFDEGVAYLKPEAKEILLKLAEILNDFPTLHIRVEGHTNSIPLNSPFLNNWRLAQARAYETMLFLKNEGNADQSMERGQSRVSFMSCGEFRPRFPNDTVENRALNRRVEIVLMQGDQSEIVSGAIEGDEERHEEADKKDFVPIAPQ